MGGGRRGWGEEIGEVGGERRQGVGGGRRVRGGGGEVVGEVRARR